METSHWVTGQAKEEAELVGVGGKIKTQSGHPGAFSPNVVSLQ